MCAPKETLEWCACCFLGALMSGLRTVRCVLLPIACGVFLASLGCTPRFGHLLHVVHMCPWDVHCTRIGVSQFLGGGAGAIYKAHQQKCKEVLLVCWTNPSHSMHGLLHALLGCGVSEALLGKQATAGSRLAKLKISPTQPSTESVSPACYSVGRYLTSLPD